MPRKQTKWNRRLMECVLRLSDSGWSDAEVARQLKINQKTFEGWVNVRYTELRRSIFGDENIPSKKDFEVKERESRVEVYARLAEQKLPLGV